MDMEDVIKGGEKSMDKVMVAIDESDCSHEALRWALDNLGDKIKSSGLIIIHVMPVDYSGVYAGSYGAALPDLIVSIQDNQKRLSAALLEKAKEICTKQGVEAETISVLGNPKDAICDATQKLHVKLLVIGSHGKGAFQRKDCSDLDTSSVVSLILKGFVSCILVSYICQMMKLVGILLILMAIFLIRLPNPSAWAFLGSVSNYCVHNAKCPVLVVRKTTA